MPFAIDEETVTKWWSEPESVVDPEIDIESRVVEYKETVWTPIGEFQNDEHRKSAEAGIQTAMLKTVVAFMNTDGGELVIGVRDSDSAITGIEVDLVSLSLDESDLDSYELRLMSLLGSRIDSLAHRQVRIDFKKHDSGTACHVSVSPSPMPRFGRPFAHGNKAAKPTFWVRAGNATEQLDGPEMVEYIAQHWA